MPINTIVITTHNGYGLTQSLLETMYLTLDMSTHDVVIVDDRSSDRTLELEGRFRFVKNMEGGLYRSWNLGIRAAKTPFVTVLNNDLLFQQRDWWRWLYLALTETNYEFVYPVNFETPLFDDEAYSKIGAADRLEKLTVVDGYGDIKAACFCARSSLFDRIGWFDERFAIWYGEKDFEIRLVQSNVRYGCVANVISRHLGNQTIQITTSTASSNPIMTERAAADFLAFKEKYSKVNLAPLGLSIKPFGPAALAI